MKCYKATYYLEDYEARESKEVEKIKIFALNKKQARKLANANMVALEVANKVEVKETKDKASIDVMNACVMCSGEDKVLKEEIEVINERRRRFGLNPIKEEDL